MTLSTAIIVPVLRRPWRVPLLLESIEAATPEPHRVLFMVSEGDDAEQAAVEAAGADYELTGRGTWPQKINDGFHLTEDPFVFTAADDLAFHPGWLGKAIDVMETALRKETITLQPGLPPEELWWFPGVVGTNDLGNPRTINGTHSTHSLVRRSYIETRSGVMDERNVVLHEGYPHEYADDELVQTAMYRKLYAHAFDSHVEHLHPWFGKADDDSTYRAGRANSAASRRRFQARMAKFGIVGPPTTRRPRRMHRA